MKIKEQYSKKLSEMSDLLNRLFLRNGMIDFNIKMLKDERTKLIENIQKIDSQKNELMQKISEEYGQGYIDPNTWEFFPQEDNKKE